MLAPCCTAQRRGGPRRRRYLCLFAHLGQSLVNRERRRWPGSQKRLMHAPWDRASNPSRVRPRVSPPPLCKEYRCPTWLPPLGRPSCGPAAPPGPSRARAGQQSRPGVRGPPCARPAKSEPSAVSALQGTRIPPPASDLGRSAGYSFALPGEESARPPAAPARRAASVRPAALRALFGIVCALSGRRREARPARPRQSASRAERTWRAPPSGSPPSAREGSRASLSREALERGPQVRGQGLGGCGWRREPRVKSDLLGIVMGPPNLAPAEGARLLRKGFEDMPELPLTPFTVQVQVLRCLPCSFLRQLSAPSEVSASCT